MGGSVASRLLGFFFNGATVPSGPELPYYRGFKITLRRATPGTTLWTSNQSDAETSNNNTRDRRLYPRRDSKPHSQQASDGKPTP